MHPANLASSCMVLTFVMTGRCSNACIPFQIDAQISDNTNVTLFAAVCKALGTHQCHAMHASPCETATPGVHIPSVARPCTVHCVIIVLIHSRAHCAPSYKTSRQLDKLSHQKCLPAARIGCVYPIAAAYASLRLHQPWQCKHSRSPRIVVSPTLGLDGLLESTRLVKCHCAGLDAGASPDIDATGGLPWILSAS